MMKPKTLLSVYLVFGLFLLPSLRVCSQQLDTDSLVQVIANDYKRQLPYTATLQKALLGKRIAPNYLDFHLFAGRMHQLLKNQDSARYYYQYVLDRNPKYSDAYPFWIQLELDNKKYAKARTIVDLGLQHHPYDVNLALKKAEIMQIQAKDFEELRYLYSIQHQIGVSKAIKQRIFYLESKQHQQHIGIDYTNTSFDQKFSGPWNLISISYRNTNKWGTALGRISYLDRRGFNDYVKRGTQYEADLYLNTFKNQYFNINLAFSNDIVFPTTRLGGNYYVTFLRSWEFNVGHRFTKTSLEEFSALAFGLGKYYGNFWFKGDFYLQKFEHQYFNSSIFTTRYYFGHRYDYGQLTLGIGTSPDDKNTVGLLQSRIGLQSKRIGLGIQKMVNNHYIIGLLSSYNHQEIITRAFQNELEITLRFQYVF